ncbi:hypothetical protein M0R45_012709 [Rubus argutus]|uniref:NPH3 domain-containing protein n=1 Tax=Rubus argutus TaxID=59490 RepID=A0AAW1XJ28_RUBAR
MRKVGKLIDAYLQVVARDANMPVSKVASLAEALPDLAREDHDDIYKAIDIYLKEHPDLSKADKKRLCRILDARSCRQRQQQPLIDYQASWSYFPAQENKHQPPADLKIMQLQKKTSQGKLGGEFMAETRVVDRREIQQVEIRELGISAGRSKLDAHKMIHRGSRSDHGRDKAKDR